MIESTVSIHFGDSKWVDAWAGPIKCSLGRKRNRGEDFMTVEEDLPDKKKQRTELVMLGINGTSKKLRSTFFHFT